MCTNAWGLSVPCSCWPKLGSSNTKCFLRGRRHNHISCIAFSYHFLSKEANKKWNLVLSVVWCSLLALLWDSTAKQSPLPSQVPIRIVDDGQILSEQPLSSTSICSKEKGDDYSKTPSLQYWLGFFGGVTAQLWGCPVPAGQVCQH